VDRKVYPIVDLVLLGTIIAMFFSVDISYVVKQRAKLNRRIKLRRFAKVGEIPEAKEIYRFLSRFSEEQFVEFVLGVLSSICAKRGRNRVLIVDSTDVSLDLNWFRER